MNNESLFSSEWYRVQEVTPWLASDVITHRHIYRSDVWFVLQRPSTNSHYRLDVATYRLIDLFDGQQTVDEVWKQALERFGDDAPTQDELLDLLAALHDADLLVVNQRLDSEHMFRRQQESTEREHGQRYLNPLYMRFKLLDPDAWLNRHVNMANVLFSRKSAGLWILLMMIAVFISTPAISQLHRELLAFEPFSPSNILMFLMLYPLIKLMHELAHAFAVKRRGGEVHELGLALMVLLPIPYVDASASTVFPDKRDRMVVNGAGIMVELAIAAVAVIVWSLTADTLHSVALTVLLISGISTLAFNANPLLKFDGYYLLADWLEIPNLAERSKVELAGVCRRRLLGQSVPRVGKDKAERYWLLSYALLSNVYRFFLMMSIAWMLSDRYFLFGVSLAVFIVVTSLLLPLMRTIKNTSESVDVSVFRRLLVLVGLPLLLSVPLLAMPMPMVTNATGVVWLPDEAVVRADNDCEVTEVGAEPGSKVLVGDYLFLCEDPELLIRIRSLQAQVDELAARSAGLVASNPYEYQRLQIEQDVLEAQFLDANSRSKNMHVFASIEGTFDISGTSELAGRFLMTGDVAAYIVPEQARTVRVALIEDHLGALKNLNTVTVRMRGKNGETTVFDSSIQRQTPEASVYVADVSLTTAGGGDLLADPSGNGLKLLRPAFELDLAWPESANSSVIGTHVGVKFRHAPEPIFARCKRWLQREFLGRMSS